MRTLGVDLASSETRTAFCVLDWEVDRAEVAELHLRASDDEIAKAHARVQATGIDAPFGWPEAFRGLVAGAHPRLHWETSWRDQLRFRLTDKRVRHDLKRWPLSVSSDLIAVPAMRCQGLLQLLGVVDRSGDGRVFEVYPAASLASWGLNSRGYKRPGRGTALQELLHALRQRMPWLRLGGPQEERSLESNDHAFDALVAALTARAAFLGLTHRPSCSERPVAVEEGWIAVPRRNSPELLLGAG